MSTCNKARVLLYSESDRGRDSSGQSRNKNVVVVKIVILKAKAKLRLWITEYIYDMNYETNGPQDHGSCGHLLHHSLIASLSGQLHDCSAESRLS